MICVLACASAVLVFMAVRRYRRKKRKDKTAGEAMHNVVLISVWGHSYLITHCVNSHASGISEYGHYTLSSYVKTQCCVNSLIEAIYPPELWLKSIIK